MSSVYDIITENVLEQIRGLFRVNSVQVRPPGVVIYGSPASPESLDAIRERLTSFGYHVSLTPVNDGDFVLEVSTRPIASVDGKRPRYWVNVALFVATIVTTILAGVTFAGGNLLNPADYLLGIPYSAALMGILLCHEMGHFVASKIHKVRASLPYFIPVPPPFLGTMGAFIKIKSPIPNRRALMDIGAAGPIAGFVVAVPITIIGLYMSEIAAMPPGTEGAIIFGESLLFKGMAYLIHGPLPEGHDIFIHPLAMAGWIGLWVTALNLLPVGQLDGGHIFYAMFGKKAVWIARIAFFGIIPLGFLWNGWLIWAVLLLFWVRLQHPPTINDNIKLTPMRWAVGIFSIVIFILTFIPIPFNIT